MTELEETTVADRIKFIRDSLTYTNRKIRGIEMTINRVSIIILLFSLFYFILPSIVNASDGNELLKSCNVVLSSINDPERKELSSEQYIKSGYCIGLLHGIMELTRIHQHSNGEPFFCLPKQSIPKEQAVRIVVKYLRDHPEKLYEHDTFLVIKALQEAFPCKKE